MPRPMTVSGSVVIAAEPKTVYELVGDPTRAGTWSPENRGATLDDSGRLLGVGSTFVGRNKRGAFRWSTRCWVIAADPGERFAFRVEAIGLRKPRIKGSIATWDYRLEPVVEGTKLTETWTDGRAGWSDRTAKVFDKIATRSTFAEFNTRNIRRSLDNLKAILERE